MGAGRGVGLVAATWLGKEMISLSSPPRRTVRTDHPVHGSSHRRTPKRRPGAVNLAVASVVYQPEIRKIVRASMFLGNHVVHVSLLAVLQSLVTDGAETLLPPRQLPRATGGGVGSAPPLFAVVL
jgi:hypothetical protein